MPLPTIPLPTIIQGPAYVSVNGVILYVQKDITLNDTPESWNPDSTFGPLGERHKARKATLEFTPVGMITSTLLDFFYAAHKTPSSIGTSIIGGTAAVIISSLTEGVTYTWSRGGMSKPPSLMLRPTSTAFGQMTVTCIGKAATSPTDAAFWKAANGTVSADTSFDQTKVISDIYSAALGSRSTPYSGMGGIAGFEIDFGFGVKDIEASDVGIADIIIMSLSTQTKFAPSNLTEAQADVLMRLQGSTAVLPGQAYASLAEDLVITGTQIGWVFTIKSQGAKASGRVYQMAEHRFKELILVNQMGFTTGVPNAMFAYTAPS